MTIKIDDESAYLKLKTVNDQIRYEFTNQDTIVLRNGGTYYKAVGSSAIMLKIFGAKTKIRSKYSAVYEQEVLELSIHSSRVDETKRYLDQYSSVVLRDDGEFYIVRLKNPVGAKRLKTARASAQLKTEVTEDLINRERQNTMAAKMVRDVFREVGILVRSMKNPDGQVLGSAILNQTIQLQHHIRVLTRTEKPSEELIQTINDIVDNIQGLLLLVPNFVEQAARLVIITRCLGKVREDIRKVRKRSANTRKDSIGSK